jgi:hypothetical protein
LPPDVRNGSAFPGQTHFEFSEASSRRRASKKISWRAGKPKAFRTSGGKAAIQSLCGFRGRALGFVGLLARADEVFDGRRGFSALPLFEFTYPVRNRIDHIPSRFAGSLAGDFGAAGFSLAALSALHNFYFFHRHKLRGEQIVIEINLTKNLFESSVPDLTCSRESND